MNNYEQQPTETDGQTFNPPLATQKPPEINVGPCTTTVTPFIALLINNFATLSDMQSTQTP